MTSRRDCLLGAALPMLTGLFRSGANAQQALTIPQQRTATEQQAFDNTFTHQSTMVNGVALHYVTGGAGTPVLLLHGWPTTWYMWRPVMQALAQQFTFVAPDLPGSGESDKPESGYDKKTMAQLMHGLMSQLNYSAYQVAAHDIGGMVGYALAAQHPEAVRRFAIMDVPLPGIPPFDQLKQDPRSWHFAFHGKRDVPELLVTGRERPYLKAFYDEHAVNPEAIPDTDVTYYASIYALPGNLRGGFEWYRAFAQDAVDNRLFAQTKIPMPVLALGGEASFGAAIVPAMQQVAIDVRGGAVPKAGHWVVEEQPAYVIHSLSAFLNGQS